MMYLRKAPFNITWIIFISLLIMNLSPAPAMEISRVEGNVTGNTPRLTSPYQEEILQKHRTTFLQESPSLTKEQYFEAFVQQSKLEYASEKIKLFSTVFADYLEVFFKKAKDIRDREKSTERVGFPSLITGLTTTVGLGIQAAKLFPGSQYGATVGVGVGVVSDAVRAISDLWYSRIDRKLYDIYWDGEFGKNLENFPKLQAFKSTLTHAMTEAFMFQIPFLETESIIDLAKYSIEQMAYYATNPSQELVRDLRNYVKEQYPELKGPLATSTRNKVDREAIETAKKAIDHLSFAQLLRKLIGATEEERIYHKITWKIRAFREGLFKKPFCTTWYEGCHRFAKNPLEHNWLTQTIHYLRGTDYLPYTKLKTVWGIDIDPFDLFRYQDIIHISKDGKDIRLMKSPSQNLSAPLKEAIISFVTKNYLLPQTQEEKYIIDIRLKDFNLFFLSYSQLIIQNENDDSISANAMRFTQEATKDPRETGKDEARD